MEAHWLEKDSPSEPEIAAMCLEIQARWTPGERRSRSVSAVEEDNSVEAPSYYVHHRQRSAGNEDEGHHLVTAHVANVWRWR